jgi:hypothetical protein
MAVADESRRQVEELKEQVAPLFGPPGSALFLLDGSNEFKAIIKVIFSISVCLFILAMDKDSHRSK